MDNVKIQYSVTLDDIPSEVGRILDDACGKLQVAQNNFSNVCHTLKYVENTNVKVQISTLKESIEQAVKGLRKIDEMIAILEGYEQVKNTPKEEMLTKSNENVEPFTDS